MRNPLKRPKRKPKFYAEIQTKTDFEGNVWLYAPNRDSRRAFHLENQELADLVINMANELNRPSLLTKIRDRLVRKSNKARPYSGLTAFDLAIAERRAADLPSTVVQRKVSRGKVIKETRLPEFNPGTPRTGGRVVKAMPRQLQKIKQAQDKVEKESSDGPKIEDIED